MKTKSKKIVWLASYPKSGNTWFRVFLENILAPSNSPSGINQMGRSSIASSRILIDQLSGISSADLTEDEIEELRPKVYKNLANDSDDFVFLKVHDAWKKTPSGEPLFPNQVTKGVIYLVRNPLDIAVSFSHHSSKKIDSTIEDMNNHLFSFCNDPKKKNHQVKQLLSDWSGHIISWLDYSGLPILAIRYEDMLDDTSNTFKRALDFLDIEVDKERFDSALSATNFEVLYKMEIEEGFKEKPMNMKSFFRNGNSGQWKHVLKPDQIDNLVSFHKDQMKRFDYYPS